MEGGDMGTYAKALPKGGETIYEVMRIGRFLDENYSKIAGAISNFVFMSELERSKHREYYLYMLQCVRRHEVAIKSPQFAKSELAGHHMAYGAWVERDLARAFFGRCHVVTLHPVWTNLQLKDQVRLITEMIFEGMLWSGAYRSAVWKGAGVFDEPEFEFVDQWNAKHIFDFSEHSTVIHLGYISDKKS